MGRGGALDDLLVQRQIEGGAERGDTGDGQQDRREREVAVAAVDAQRHQRLPRAALGGDEGGQQREGQDGQADDLPRAPGVGAARPGGGHDAGGDRTGEKGDAPPVQARLPLTTSGGHAQHDPAPGDADHAEGHVDVEGPAPAQVTGDEAADQGPAQLPESHDAGDHALVPAALPRWQQDTDQSERSGTDATRAQALEHAGDDQRVHRGSHAAEHRGREEEHDRGEEHRLAVEQVAELAPYRGGAGGGQGVAGDHPRHVVQPAEVRDDGRHRGTDDEAVEHRQQQGQHEAEQDPPDVLGQFDGVGRCRGTGRAGGGCHGGAPLSQGLDKAEATP